MKWLVSVASSHAGFAGHGICKTAKRRAGRMQLMATIDDPGYIQRILAHLALPGAMAGPPSPPSGAAARAERPALPDMTLEQAPEARATAQVCTERPGGRRPLAASRLRCYLSHAP